MQITVGAYPTYPTYLGSGAEFEAETRAFLRALSDDPRVGGFEIPFAGYNQPTYRNGTWPKGAAEDKHVVITDIPGTMGAQAQMPTFGLASNDPRGREAALEFTRALNARARMLVAQGYRVRAVLIHSAPSHNGSATALRESLAQVCGWDWYGVPVLLEHCDAAGGATRPQKAYLSLDSEIEVLDTLYGDLDGVTASGVTRTHLGIVINWARSVIETGKTETALEHLRQAREAGYLRGFMFCGVAPVATEFGPAWEDAHMPPAGIGACASESLLTARELTEVWREAGEDLLFKGMKIQLAPADLSISERVAQFQQIMDMVAV